VNAEEHAWAPFVHAEVEVEIYEEVIDAWCECYAALVIGWKAEVICEPVVAAAACNIATGDNNFVAIIVTALCAAAVVVARITAVGIAWVAAIVAVVARIFAA